MEGQPLTESIIVLLFIHSDFHPQQILPCARRSSCSTVLLKRVKFLVMLVNKTEIISESTQFCRNHYSYVLIRVCIASSSRGSPPFFRIASWKYAVLSTATKRRVRILMAFMYSDQPYSKAGHSSVVLMRLEPVYHLSFGPCVGAASLWSSRAKR